MNLLYISVLASQDVISYVQKHNSKFSNFAVHKFNRLVVEGMVHNGQNVTALSTFYQPSKGFFWYHHSERIHGVKYKYIPTLNYGLFRHSWLVVYCFCYVLFWGILHKETKALMCDVLNISACMGAVAAARLIGLKRVGIMTDMPGLMVERSHQSISDSIKAFNAKMNKSFLGHFSHYVFLTEQMNKAVNINHRPYIVMEGLVGRAMMVPEKTDRNSKRIILYAGGLHERYGLRILVEGFMKANVENSELWLYGSGPFVYELPNYSNQDSRIKYKGICSNEEVVEAELRATLLVNPRPSHEEFTQYSFPSKNLEYMVSGTPVLTTILPGMPKEYYPYVYLFDKGETTEGYAEVIQKTLSLPIEQLVAKGAEAKQWVLSNKSYVRQTARIIEIL